MLSKITGGPTEFLFSKKVLDKYLIKYYQCIETGFIQTEDPYWLEEAYSNVITSLDVGLTNRNLTYAEKVATIITRAFEQNSTFLDYGAGIGLFVRMMRDRGYQFYWDDLHAPNILALGFGLDDLEPDHKFELLTAFEVFEHLVNPMQSMEDMLKHSRNILFSTELVPDKRQELESWWYILPETGQHISFYTQESLRYLAMRHKLNLYSNNKDFHLLTEKTFNFNPLHINNNSLSNRFLKALQIIRGKSPEFKRQSLIGSDYTYILNALKTGKKFRA